MKNKSLNYIKNSLSEHFDNFAVIAINSEGDLIWDYSNWMVAVMLMDRARDLIENDADDADIIFIDEEDDDDDLGFPIKL
jgi:hypothetical protein